MSRIRMIKILAAVAILFAVCQNFAWADDQTAANDLLDKAIKAQGGEAALAKIVGFEVNLKGTNFDGDNKVPSSTEITCQGYDKIMSLETNSDTKAETIEVVNGDDGWTKEGDKPAEAMNDQQLKAQKHSMYMNWITTVLPFKEKGYKLTAIDEVLVAGKPAEGLLVSHKKREPVKLYFDKKSHLLVKTEDSLVDADSGAKRTIVTIYADYKAVQGIQQPFKMKTYVDGVKVNESDVVDMKIHEKPIDERLFTKP